LHIVIPSELADGIILRQEDSRRQGKRSLRPAHDALMKIRGENALLKKDLRSILAQQD
jgi:hypothetical protein